MRVWYCLIQLSFSPQFLLCGIVCIQYRRNWHNFIFQCTPFSPLTVINFMKELSWWRRQRYSYPFPLKTEPVPTISWGDASRSMVWVCPFLCSGCGREARWAAPPVGLCMARAHLLMSDVAETCCSWLWHIAHHFWEQDWSLRVNYFSSKVALLFCVTISWFSNYPNSF